MILADGLSRPQLRKLLRNARNSLSPAQQKQAARDLQRQLAQHPLFRRSRHVALYLASDGEIDPQLLCQTAWRRGKSVYLPVLQRWPKSQMTFQRLERGERLRPNRFGIAEPRPQPARQRQPWALDLVCLPLVGFDSHGGRLGMGGGFYDRKLAFLHMRKKWHKPTLLGLAHACQQVDRLPQAAWDIPLDAVISDRARYR